MPKTTKHCPKCESEELAYYVDIFKRRTPEYYTGEVKCNNCNFKFNKSEIKYKSWFSEFEVDELKNKLKEGFRTKDGKDLSLGLADRVIDSVFDEVTKK